MALEDTLRRLDGFPPTLRERIAAVPGAKFSQRSASGGFCLLEHLCHLRDYEIEGVHGRAASILENDKPYLPDFNGNRDYSAEVSGEDAFTAWASARRRTIELFGQLAAADLDRPATLGSYGGITLATLCDVLAEHDTTHLDETDELLREVMA